MAGHANLRKLECQHCHTLAANVLLAEKLNPRNLHPMTLRLCTKCRGRLGYQTNRYGRGKGRLPGGEP